MFNIIVISGFRRRIMKNIPFLPLIQNNLGWTSFIVFVSVAGAETGAAQGFVHGASFKKL